MVHLLRPANNLYDLGASQRWQVYNGLSTEYNTTQVAVSETAEQILSYQYVLAGSYTLECEAEQFEGIEESFIFVPQGAVHKYTVGAKGGRLLVVPPSGLERYFREVSQILVQGSLDLEVEHIIAEQYGQEFVDRLCHWGL